MGDLFPAFRVREEDLSVLAPAVSQVALIQSHHCAIVLVGAACPGPLHMAETRITPQPHVSD